MQDIAHKFDCSVHAVQYWMQRHDIARRSISDAVYRKHHPKGDPFRFVAPKTHEDRILFGLGVGLYWGEGTKASKHAVRLGNTDPALIECFMDFLVRFFSIKRKDFRFGLQIFTDVPAQDALAYWISALDIQKTQFYKVTVTKSGSLGTYRKKSRFGVLTVYYHNTKVRDILVRLCRRSSGVEHFHGKERVTGSNPVGGSTH